VRHLRQATLKKKKRGLVTVLGVQGHSASINLALVKTSDGSTCGREDQITREEAREAREPTVLFFYNNSILR
jgi:hypothetical protein